MKIENIRCNVCKYPIRYQNKLAWLWWRYGACCVKCQRKMVRKAKAHDAVGGLH